MIEIENWGEVIKDNGKTYMINPISTIGGRLVNDKETKTYAINVNMLNMKKSTLDKLVYEDVKGFFIDIVYSKTESGEGIYEVWLYHEDYGVKESIVGLPEIQNGKKFTWENIRELIFDRMMTSENNPLLFYYSRYMDECECK